ncbi:predicted protein [Naegleria gruberi]|nr:uncharacterized protein NAEGRDRAFT_73321 [Naegleria gruberi]EFC38804.1 predicted protein [Naegleria gruberi]|eukprot:XP_002671548.1 predicted protein [Naegleria gruberi strain NEG-M]
MGVKSSNIFICILHMDERITEYILKMTLKTSELEKQMKTNICSLEGFADFNFHSSSVLVKDTIEEENALTVKEYSFMLSGGHCNKLFGSFDKVFGFLKDSNSNMYNIWKKYKSIRQWLYYTNEDLEKKSLKDWENFDSELNEWRLLFVLQKADSGRIGDYIHIATAHLYDLLSTYGSLVPLSNQGVESSHQLDCLIMERGTSKGKMSIGTKKAQAGSSKPNVETVSKPASHTLESSDLDNEQEHKEFNYESFIKKTESCDWNDLFQVCQIMLKKLRKLYLSFTCEEVLFVRLERRTGKVIRKDWTRDILTMSPNFTLPIRKPTNVLIQKPDNINTEVISPQLAPSQDVPKRTVELKQSQEYGLVVNGDDDGLMNDDVFY